MVVVEPFPPIYPYPYPNTIPNDPLIIPTFTEETIKKKHIKTVKKGIFLEFEDGSWTFIATDDDCFKKIKEALKDENL